MKFLGHLRTQCQGMRFNRLYLLLRGRFYARADKRGMNDRIRREQISRDTWQGQVYTKSDFQTSLESMSNGGAVL